MIVNKEQRKTNLDNFCNSYKHYKNINTQISEEHKTYIKELCVLYNCYKVSTVVRFSIYKLFNSFNENNSNLDYVSTGSYIEKRLNVNISKEEYEMSLTLCKLYNCDNLSDLVRLSIYKLYNYLTK